MIKSENLKHEISFIFDEIYHSIPIEEDISLMYGKSGIMLFLFEYAKTFQSNEAYNKATDLLTSVSKNLALRENTYTFSKGITGICWIIDYTLRQKYIKLSSDFFVEIDRYLMYKYVEEAKSSNWDFLNGNLGLLLFYIQRAIGNEILRNRVEEFLNILYVAHISSNNWIMFWKTQKDGLNLNLGIPHGIVGILKIFFLAFKNNILKEQSLKLIYKIIDTIKSCELSQPPSKSKFPAVYNYVGETFHSSRIGWCYGDLAIAYILVQIAIELNDKELLFYSKNIAFETCRRTTIEKDTLIFDSCFYYGASGVAYIYKKLYELTGDVSFFESAHYWLKTTMKNNESEYAQYLFRNRHTKNWNKNYSLLEGLSGVGLVWLSFINKESHFWDECFLLS